MITGSHETDVVLAVFIQFVIVIVFGVGGITLLEPKTKHWAYILMIIGLILFIAVGAYFDKPDGLIFFI